MNPIKGVFMKSAWIFLPVLLGLVLIQSASAAEELSGLGVKLTEKKGQIVLDTVFPETPAEQAGLRSGEAILTIDGKSIHGKTVQDVQKNLAGPAGTKVKLLIQDNEGNTRTVEATRKSFRMSAEGPSDFIGEFVSKDDPEMKIVVKQANEKKYQIFCEQENWSGAGAIYQNPTFKSFHFKGVFSMNDNPKVESAMRGVVGFFRINYLSNGAMELKRQWGLEGDQGSKSTATVLIRADGNDPAANKSR
jgi:hypothetical protein